METKDNFNEMFEEHLKLIRKKLLLSSNELVERAFNHDSDKIFNPTVNKAYENKFPELKKIPFGTTEYFDFEKKYFDDAHQIHAQNRHHFYSHRNSLKDVNLFDMIEAIIDISESSKQYGNSKYKEAFERKGLYDYNLKELIDNTIEYLQTLENKK